MIRRLSRLAAECLLSNPGSIILPGMYTGASRCFLSSTKELCVVGVAAWGKDDAPFERHGVPILRRPDRTGHP